MKRKRIAALLLALVLCLGLLPMTVMAEEEHTESFTITFDADGGQFPGGGETWTTRTKWLGAGNNITETPPYPERSGYIFDGWDAEAGGSIGNVDFTADATVKAKWRLNSNLSRPLDANGGTVSPDHFNVDDEGNIIGRLPTPTRPGYVFQGWYIDGKPIDESKPLASTAPFPVAQWKRASKVTPTLTATPNKIEDGTEKVEIVLSCPDSGVSLDWRPLERGLYMGDEPSDWESAAKSLLSGNFSAVGLKLTKVFYQDVANDSGFPEYPYELYPEGICPASGLVLTLEGKAKAGTLTIQLSGENFLTLVPDEGNTVTASSADIFNAAKVSIPVGGGQAASKDGPFTVKFDLNYKNAKASETPKEQKIAKGGTVSLPDGGKLTPPAKNYEFGGWRLKADDGKLYPWNDQQAVTADMTLYAEWVEKGTAQQTPSKTETPAQPAAPGKTAFTDVAATSPFAAAISWAVEQKITNGKTATTFGPGDPCTRAQIVTFLWRAAGSPEPKTLEAEYADVTKTDAYYYKAVQWAAEMGMEESGTFAPDKTCTRGQAMYFIWKANDSGTSAGSVPSFTDLPKDSLYHDAVLWAVSQGVTKGTGDGTTFSPDNPCTRGQIVTFLYRAYVK